MISPTLGVGETAGKPSLRGLRNRPEQPAVIAPASEFSCAIFHLPLRSFEQYRTRLGIGLRIAQTRESEQLERRINEVIGEDAAADRWHELVGDQQAVAEALEAGELVEDTRLRDMLRAIGPPGADGSLEPPPYSAEPPAEGLDAARAELTREALAGLTHNHAQTLGERDSATASLAAKHERLMNARRKHREKTKDLRLKLTRVRKQARAAERRVERIRGQPLVAVAAPLAEALEALEPALEHGEGSARRRQRHVASDRLARGVRIPAAARTSAGSSPGRPASRTGRRRRRCSAGCLRRTGSMSTSRASPSRNRSGRNAYGSG